MSRFRSAKLLSRGDSISFLSFYYQCSVCPFVYVSLSLMLTVIILVLFQILNMGYPRPLCWLLSNNSKNITVDFSAIRTRIVKVVVVEQFLRLDHHHGPLFSLSSRFTMLRKATTPPCMAPIVRLSYPHLSFYLDLHFAFSR